MPLNGLVVPAISLFADDGKLDLAKNTRFIRGLIDDGVRHILSLGSPGEAELLTPEELEALLEKVVESCTFGTDVWAGIDAPTTEDAVARADTAEAAGASVLVAFPPPAPSDAGMVLERFRSIHAQSKLPLLAYQVTGQARPVVPATVYHTLAKEGTLAGVLDAAGSPQGLDALLQGAPSELSVFTGDGAALTSARGRGARGLVWESANVLPRLASKIWETLEKGPQDRLAPLLALQDVVVQAVRAGPQPSSLKFLAHYLREADEGYRAPNLPLTPEQSSKLVALVEPHKAALQEYA